MPPRSRSRSRSSLRGSSAPSAPSTAPRSTSELHDVILVAVIDNAVKEVGLCAFNVSSFDIELRQFADNNTYASTIAVLRMLDPSQIILSSSSYETALHESIIAVPELSLKRVSLFLSFPCFHFPFNAPNSPLTACRLHVTFSRSSS